MAPDPTIIALFEARDGTRVPVRTRADLAEMLTDETLQEFLVAHGLRLERCDDLLRAPAAELHQVLLRVAESLPSAPADVKVKLADRELAAEALIEMARVVEGGASRDCDVVVAFDAELHLRSVPEPPDPVDVLLAMEKVEPEGAAALLETLDAVFERSALSPELLGRTLIPLLEIEQTAGLAARILGRAKLSEATDAMMGCLARTRSLDTRLELLAALMSLGQRAFGFRTLRSILVYGSPEARQRAVALLREVATARDARTVGEMLRLVPKPERLELASLLYGLGDKTAYAIVAEHWAELGDDSSGDEVEALLRATRRTGSRRFTTLVSEYADRETRPWFAARARAVATELAKADDRGGEEPPEVLLDLAEEAYFGNRVSVALDHLEELLALDQKLPRAMYLYANCLKEEERPEEALAACDDALNEDKTYWRTHRLRGSLLWDLGRHEEALAAYDHALALNPVDAYTWYYKGYVLYRLRRDEAALPCLDRALSLKHDSPYIHNQKAFCLERLKRHEEAVRCYQKSLQLKPGDLAIRDYMGQALQASGKLDEALDCFEQLLRTDSLRIETLYHRADVLYDLERWEDAAEAFAFYIERSPENHDAWFNRGLCLRFLRRYADAAECFAKALELRPESTNARRYLVYCRQMASRSPGSSRSPRPPRDES